MLPIFLPFWIHQTEVKHLRSQIKDKVSLTVAHDTLQQKLKQV